MQKRWTKPGTSGCTGQSTGRKAKAKAEPQRPICGELEDGRSCSGRASAYLRLLFRHIPVLRHGCLQGMSQESFGGCKAFPIGGRDLVAVGGDDPLECDEVGADLAGGEWRGGMWDAE